MSVMHKQETRNETESIGTLESRLSFLNLFSLADSLTYHQRLMYLNSNRIMCNYQYQHVQV